VFESFQNITRVPELKRRILVTGLLLIVYRIGIYIPTPGIDNLALKAVFDSQAGTLFGMIDMFSGGALARFSIFTLGIMPYISSSIILQLLTVVIPQLEKRTSYVALGANIATLLGLLGTIIGLIQAFQAVANANPAEKADLLSASISVAMNTTAFGLMSAIPLLLFHAKLTSTTGHIVDSLEMASVKALNSISDFNKRRFESTSEIPGENRHVSSPEPLLGTAQ